MQEEAIMTFVKGQSGNPQGKIPGTKNKYTRVKEAMVELFEEVHGKEKLKQMMQTPDGFFNVMKHLVVPILPKEPLIDQSTTTVTQIIQYDNSTNTSTRVQRSSTSEPVRSS